MSKTFVCIVCPNSCKIEVDGKGDQMTFRGNLCKRGIEFARNEMTNPKRSVTTTVKTVYPEYLFIPVKTKGEVPKSKIFELMNEISKITVATKLKDGDIIIKDC